MNDESSTTPLPLQSDTSAPNISSIGQKIDSEASAPGARIDLDVLEMMDIAFHNVTIRVSASSPREAYDLLCNTLGANDAFDWETDTFDTNGADGNMDSFRCTSELFPEDQ